MPLDSISKRMALVGIGGNFFVGPMVLPDGAISDFDRHVLAHVYDGQANEQITSKGICLSNASIGPCKVAKLVSP